MTTTPRARPVWIGVALLLLAAGCHSGKARLSPVHGRVYYQGSPLTCGTIVFAPDPGRGPEGALARGEIKPDGSFSLQTDGKSGAAPGWYRVTILSVEMPAHPEPGQRYAEPHTLVPERYRDPDLAGLTREVQEGPDNTVDFHLD